MKFTFLLKMVGVGLLGLSMTACKSAPEKAADKNLNDLKSASSNTAVTSVGGKTLPAECEAYVTKVDSCVKKMAANNPMAASFKTSMEQARAGWANMPDQVALAGVCKQADAAFSQNAAGMGCK